MKLFLKIGVLVFISLFLFSCEDEVEIDLPNGKTELVVDAWINTLAEDQVIRLSTTAPYFLNAPAPTVSGAEVYIENENGIRYDFQEQETSGQYVWKYEGENLGEIGKNYTLNIAYNGINYFSNTRLNPSVPVDSITYEYRTDELVGPDGYYAEVFALDRPGIGDAYWIKTYKNGQFLNKPQEINIAYDAGLSTGAEVDGIIFITPIREAVNRIPDEGDEAVDTDDFAPYAIGDTLRVEVHSISEEAFYYLERARIQLTLGDATIFAEPPANVPTNIRSDAETENPQGFFVFSEVYANEVVIEE